jgi:hypothetical protein
MRSDLGLVAFPHEHRQGPSDHAGPARAYDRLRGADLRSRRAGGGGKIPLLPDYVVGREGDELILRNFEGKTYRYTDPDGTVGADRALEAGAL